MCKPFPISTLKFWHTNNHTLYLVKVFFMKLRYVPLVVNYYKGSSMKNSKSCLSSHLIKIFFLTNLFLSTSVQSFETIDLQLTLDVDWTSTPQQTEVDLGMASANDVWIIRVKLGNIALSSPGSCNNGSCASSAFISEAGGGSISVSVQSSTEPDLSLTPFRYHAFRSRDVFEYFSDGNVEAGDYLGFTDVMNGLYAPTGGNQLESWLLTRNMFSLSLSEEIEANSIALIQYLSSGNASFEVQEHFLNHLQQVSYSKFGTATVASVLVINAQNNPYPLECNYAVVSNWGNGFQSLVSLKNVSNAPVHGWLTNIKFADAFYIDAYWNATVSGINPDFVATSNSGNKTIYPGQEVNFGFLASKAASQSVAAVITGKLCR